MANGIITGQELGVDEFVKLSKAAELASNEFKELLSGYNEIVKAAQNFKTVQGNNDVLTKKIALDEKQAKLLTQIARLEKEKANALAASNRAEKSSIQTKSAQLSLDRRINAEASRTASFYKQQSRQLTILRDRYKSLVLSKTQGIKLTKQENAELKRLEIQVKKLDKALKKTDAAAGQFNRNVGNYPSALRGATSALRSFVGAFGFTSGIFLFATALKDAFARIQEFDQSQADLAAILGRSKNEIQDLTEQAKILGATTAFTATQVAQLQLELAKLGFDDNQILAATEGVENLAIATGVDASRAAKLAGAALRGFNLDASESNRVASALAVSTTKSASSFETLEVALPKVSAIAKSFGFTIEDTTALLGGLQNAGFEASIAGTSLRQIFLQLADANGKLAQRLGGGAENFDQLIEQFKKVEAEGISLGEAFNLTNARSVAAFKVFLSGADDLKVLRDSIIDVEDELKQLADTKLDSLIGDTTLLNSAYEGLILSIEDGNGSIANFFRGTTQGVTGYLEELKLIEDAQSRVFKLTGEEESNFTINKALKSLSLGLIDVKSDYDELIDTQREFTRFLGELDNNTGFSFLEDELNRLNNEIQNNTSLTEGQKELYREQIKEIEGVFNKNKEYRNELETQTLAIVEATEGFENYGIEVQNLSNNALVDFIAANKDVLDSINKVTQGLDAAVDGRRTLSEIDEDIKAQKELLQQATAEEASAILDLIDVLNKEREAFERKRKSGKKVQENLKGTTGFIEEQISKYEKLIKSTARTSEEYEEFSKKIKALREELFNLNSAFELVDGKNSKVDFKINLQLAGKNARKNFLKNLKEEIKKDEELKKSLQSNIDKALAELDRFNEARLNGEKIYNDYVKEQAQEQRDFRARIAGELFGTFANYYNLDLRAFQDLLEGKTFLETDYAATVNSIVDSVYAGKFQKYEQDLQKNQERLDAVLNDENASDKKKEQARIEFDRKEKELNIKKAKAQRDALLFQIAIDTAQTIAKILLNAAALSSNPITAALAANAYAQAGIAAGFGIAQAAIVSRQALPEFFLGKDRFNNFEGWGTVGEKRKEVIIGGDGSIEVTPNKKTPRFINRDDIIVPSLSQFNRQIQQPNSDLSKTLATRLGKDTKERLSLFQTSPAFDQRSMQNMMEKVMSKYMSKPFNINNNVTIKQKRTKFHV